MKRDLGRTILTAALAVLGAHVIIYAVFFLFYSVFHLSEAALIPVAILSIGSVVGYMLLEHRLGKRLTTHPLFYSISIVLASLVLLLAENALFSQIDLAAFDPVALFPGLHLLVAYFMVVLILPAYGAARITWLLVELIKRTTSQ